ncbi:MAG TPA: TraR/DksA family transcriptional regulator [Candidatus Binataceae bacterium]|nr:TraR/DksA family transcriptional regulator [Candidatus Binataceae bacterium]
MTDHRMSADAERHNMLRNMLVRLRDETYQRVKELRRDQEQEAEPPPADEMDMARSTADIEMHAGLIARQEEKLRFVDEALSRLDAGRYGICLGCHGPIPIERLMALPLAPYCVDCQKRRNRTERDWGAGTSIAPYDRQWTPPEEMAEPAEREYRSTGPEEEMSVRFERPFGPEEPKAPAPARRKKSAGPHKKRSG